jgi:dolichol-phosphate mannosyltransferase
MEVAPKLQRSEAETDTIAGPRIGVVIPCYRVRDTILDVIKGIPEYVESIICVDDSCPEGAGDFIQATCRDPRVTVVRNPKNLGVGGAMIAGYQTALAQGMDIVVKIDGDGQMDPALLPDFVDPLIGGLADYTKGNRFFWPTSTQGMPMLRLIGNAGLSFLTKASSGYWRIMDPTNGYTAIHSVALRALPLDRLANRYFFESDILFRLYTARAVVLDIPMDARYAGEKSSLTIHRVLLPFLLQNLRNMGKRFIYSYFVRDFNLASVMTILGIPMLLFGMIFGTMEWIESGRFGSTASAGTVMVAALPIIVGLQLILSALSFDLNNQPQIALQNLSRSKTLRRHR